jgi:selenocysteine lyase/cysteine desulfurase
VVQIDKSLFPRATEVVYLDTAAEGLPPATVKAAIDRYIEAKGRGTPGRSCLYAVERDAIAAAARLLGTEPANVAFLAHASDGLNQLANSIEWVPGDEVLLTDLEFPSNVVPWLRLRERGVNVRVLNSQQGIVELDTIVSAITPKTRVVSVSYVSYKTGTRLNYLTDLAKAAHASAAIFCVDATQALGRLPVPLEGVDFLVASSYKWLLGIHGLGVVYVSPELHDRMRPSTVGWYSVENLFAPDRFERFEWKRGAAGLQAGMPNFCAIFVLEEALRCLLQVRIECIEASLRPVVSRLHGGLEELGLQLLTPPHSELASGIVSFRYPDAEQLGTQLEREGIVVWAGDGRVRASVHLYNDLADVNHLLGALARLVKAA